MEALWFLVGAAVSALSATAWLFRQRAADARRAAADAARLAGVEAEAGVLREQLQRRESELTAARAALDAEREARVRYETQSEQQRLSLSEQQRRLDETVQRLREVFTALASDALKGNSEQFARQTEEKTKPLREALERYERLVQEMEKTRQTAYGGLVEQLKVVHQTSSSLEKQTASLLGALRAPQVRGRWGEVTLERVVEAAGMSRYCDFRTQVSVEGDGGRLRPDLTVQLPGGRSIVVDAKAPLAAYLDALEAPDEAARAAALARHARQLREHVRKLSEKSYWKQIESTVDFVVLFVPGESFFSAALEQDRELLEDAFQARVLLSTPTTLVALLRSVAHGWQQRDLVDNAQRIGDAARVLHERVDKFGQHLARVGEGLRRAVTGYNDAVGSFESRVLPAGRRIAELGAAPGVDASEPPSRVDAVPRQAELGLHEEPGDRPRASAPST